MARPVVGIIGNRHLINEEYLIHGTGVMNSAAIRDVAGAVPLIVPPDPAVAAVDDLLDCCDGFVFTGGRPNVHPDEYGHCATSAHGEFDRNRDAVALPLIRAAVQRGQPIFAICRGFQELNVAMGGTLHPEIREIPGRMNHRMPPDGTLDEKFALRHEVHFTPGGPFARLIEAETVMTNTLHGQGICQPADRLVIDGRAGDGTPEAVYVRDAPGFAMGVQWHPEYNATTDPVSRKLFTAFGQALADWASTRRAKALGAASPGAA